MTTPTWAPGLTGIRDKGFGGSRNGETVDGAVLHHTANGGGTSALEYVANANSRNSHPTYLVQKDGAAFGIVNPVRRPYSTAGNPDDQCVSFEIDNSAGAPDWTVTKASMETVARIILHHYRQSPRYGKGIARNIVGKVQKEFFIAWHSQYVATACPGPSVMSQIDWLIKRVLELDKPTPPAPTPTPVPVPAPDLPDEPPVPTTPSTPPEDWSDELADIEADVAAATAGDSAPLSGLFAGHDKGRKRAYLIYAGAALLISFGPDIVTANVLATDVVPTFVAIVSLSASILLKIGTALGFVAAANTSK